MINSNNTDRILINTVSCKRKISSRSHWYVKISGALQKLRLVSSCLSARKISALTTRILKAFDTRAFFGNLTSITGALHEDLWQYLTEFFLK